MRRVSNTPGQGPSPLYPPHQPSLQHATSSVTPITMAGRGQTNPYPNPNPNMDPYHTPTAQPPPFPEPMHSGYPAGQNRLPPAGSTTTHLPNPLPPTTTQPPPPAAIVFTDLTAAGASDPGSADDSQPANNYGTWTPAEDRTLLAARSRGHHWASIQRDFFPAKTANACRKRHERLMERQGTNHLDARRLERVAKEYMNMRQEMWSGLAARMGEPWDVVEGQGSVFALFCFLSPLLSTRREREKGRCAANTPLLHSNSAWQQAASRQSSCTHAPTRPAAGASRGSPNVPPSQTVTTTTVQPGCLPPRPAAASTRSKKRVHTTAAASHSSTTQTTPTRRGRGRGRVLGATTSRMAARRLP
ncbi:hypothetical protein B0T22DRAFT_472479 [Podospora appendiculata]|uniref:Myb-like domain-containing protein n=1 Tax=Podospora appendiculata TaxID=314037 RepID=A0AAE0WZN6_9PEZI|nr:hypothetical protein B0T22DRAFT_472479 [Podospora appendiculata]